MGHKTSSDQFEIIKAKTYRSWELSKLAKNIEPGADELFQRLFALV